MKTGLGVKLNSWKNEKLSSHPQYEKVFEYQMGLEHNIKSVSWMSNEDSSVNLVLLKDLNFKFCVIIQNVKCVSKIKIVQDTILNLSMKD